MKGLRRNCWTNALVLGVAGSFGGCVTRPTVPPPPSLEEVCKSVQEVLASAVPPGESQADLEARGIRIRTPINWPPGAALRPLVPSGAAVQMLIQPDGRVAAGSPKTLKSVGELQIASAMELAALSMSFDFDLSAKPTGPVAFTTTYVACARS